MLVAATNGSAAFSAGDPNFAARSLALKKKKKGEGEKEAEKDSGTTEQGERESRCDRSSYPVRAHHVSVELAGTPETPRRCTLGTEALRGVGPSGSRPPLGRGSPWLRRSPSRGAIS